MNPRSVDVARLRTAVAAEEQRASWAPSMWFETTAEDAGGQAARAALRDAPDLLLIAGGDGTVRAVAEAIHPSELPVALVPTGTGNLLARNLGLMADVEVAVSVAFTGTTRTIDLGLVELEERGGERSSHAFLVMTGVGLDAKMATDTDAHLKRRIGWLAYAHPISRSVVRNEQFWMHYRIDGGREQSVQAHTVIVGNCGTLTAGIVLLPDAKPDDQLLDVVLLRPRGFWQWLRVGSRIGVGALLHRTRRGRIALRAFPDLRALQYVQASRVEARFDTPQHIELDGDGFGSITRVAVSVHPRGLAVRTPNL